MMEYKGYLGRAEVDSDAGLIHGEVIGTRDVITYQAQSLAELVQEFHRSVDDYLAFCAELGEEPDKPFSGQFVTRIAPDVHRLANLAATASGKSLNAWVGDVLQAAVATTLPNALKRKRPVSRAGHARPATRRKSAKGPGQAV